VLGFLLCWSALRFRWPSPEKGVWGTRVLLWWENPLSTHKVQLHPHHTVWGRTNCNERGSAMLEFLNATNLEILYQGSYSTFSEYQSEEVSQSIVAYRRAYCAALVYWIYFSVIRPSITFTSLTWWPGCQRAVAKIRLSMIQRLLNLEITGTVRTASTGAIEPLTRLPPLDLVAQGEARSAAHRLCSLGFRSYLQKSDHICKREFDVMRPTFNFELTYRLTKLTREEWTRGPRTPLHLRGSSAIQKGPRSWGEPGLDSMNNLREESSVSV